MVLGPLNPIIQTEELEEELEYINLIHIIDFLCNK